MTLHEVDQEHVATIEIKLEGSMFNNNYSVGERDSDSTRGC